MITTIAITLLLLVTYNLLLQQKVFERRIRELSMIEDRLALSQAQVAQLDQQVSALCSASVGTGNHIVKLEQKVQRLNERQNKIEMRATGGQNYLQANQLVDKGADCNQLIESCGLTQGEAELLVVMQGNSANTVSR